MFIVSFATPKYEIECYKLLDDLRSWKIPHEIHFIEGKGSWLKSVLHKAIFIKEMMLKHNRPIVWLDADTEIKQYPQLFEEITEDFAVNYFEPTIACGGVLFFNTTPKGIKLLDAWITEIYNNPGDNDQVNLYKAIQKNPDVSIKHLPREYCTFDLCKDQSNPVLWSRQASRRLKDIKE